MLRTSLLTLAVVVASFACGESPNGPSDPSNPSGSSGSSGNLNIRITDTPYGSAKAVLVTFSEVALLRGSDWTRVPFPDSSAPTWTCDLKKLQNRTEDLLGTGRLELANYTMVRLVIQSAKIYFDNSAQSPTPCARSIPEPAGASFPFAMATREVQVNGSFPVRAGAATTVLVDFDGEASISQSGPGAYMMNPVVRLLSVQ